MPPPPPAERIIPSNLPRDVAFDTRSEVVLDGLTYIDELADPPVLQALSGEYTVRRYPQSNGGRDVVAFFMRDLVVRPGAVVRVQGDQPVIFVVAKTATVDGVIDVSADHRFAVAGGSVTSMDAFSDGTGPGAGRKATEVMHTGASGGGACGSGGGFSNALTAGASNLMPLRGGSSGGMAGTGAYGGAGGGAFQLFAAERLSIGATGSIRANGGGGTQYGGAGGSGGSILLESKAITIAHAKALSVNGGGGGANYFAGALTDNSGENGSPDGPGAGGNPVPDAVFNDPRNSGGSGGAPNGVEGAYLGKPNSTGFVDVAGGGGGGLGFIRFNVGADGGVTWNGGSTSGPCTSVGQVWNNGL